MTFKFRNLTAPSGSKPAGRLAIRFQRGSTLTALFALWIAAATYGCDDDNEQSPSLGTGGTHPARATGSAGANSSANNALGGVGGTSEAVPSGGGTPGTTANTGSTSVAGAATTGAAGSVGAAGAPSITPTYWEDGKTGGTLDPLNDDRLWGVTFGKNGEIYAAGSLSSAAGDRQIVVAKYDAQATLDKNFGVNGLAILNASPYLGEPDDPATQASDPDPSVEEARALVVQSDGKIVVVGRAEDPKQAAPTRATPSDLILFRLNSDGTRDLSFGDPAYDGTPLDGVATLSFGDTPEDQVWGLEIDANDRLYAFAAGKAADATRTDTDRYVVRWSPNGTLDASFGSGGLATFDVPQSSLTGTAPVTLKLNDNPRHGVVLPDGSVLSSGYTSVAGRNQLVLAKFTSAGALDASFSGDGVARIAPFANGMAEVYGVAVQSEAGVPSGFVTTGYGRIDVESTTRTDVDLVSFRLNAQGEFDSSWASGGAFVLNLTGGEDRGRDALALPDNRILMVGTGVVAGQNKDALLVLLEKNGAVAQDFDPTGQKLYEFGGTNEEFFAAAISRDGQWIAAVGYAGASSGGLSNGNSTLVVLPVGR